MNERYMIGEGYSAKHVNVHEQSSARFLVTVDGVGLHAAKTLEDARGYVWRRALRHAQYNAVVIEASA